MLENTERVELLCCVLYCEREWSGRLVYVLLSLYIRGEREGGASTYIDIQVYRKFISLYLFCRNREKIYRIFAPTLSCGLFRRLFRRETVFLKHRAAVAIDLASSIFSHRLTSSSRLHFLPFWVRAAHLGGDVPKIEGGERPVCNSHRCCYTYINFDWIERN